MYVHKPLTMGMIREILQSGNMDEISKIPKEDLEMFLENDTRREFIDIAGIKNLYAGICEMAVTDYKTSHKSTVLRAMKGDTTKIKSRYENEMEHFFGSDFFLNVSGLRSKKHAVEVIEQTIREDLDKTKRTARKGSA